MEKKTLKTIGLITFIFSLLVFSGGVMGFAMKNSIPSLVAGSFFGLSLLYSSIKTMAFHRWGLVTTFILLLILDSFFSYRFLTTQKFFPAGAMLLLTTLVVVIQIFQLRKLKHLAKN
ncbi:MAG: TMEM14 family protein [Simkaniaceae bacterium]|nr:MAG: TMEM14 family protein [Simkaniaceae bacterium]